MTTQVAEHICYEGIELLLLCEPALPLEHARLIVQSDEDTASSCRDAFTTSCWRNYVAQWSIRRGELFLDRVCGRYRLADGPPVAATWYSGVLRMAIGQVVEIHGGHGSRFRQEFFAELEDGAVVRTWNEFFTPADEPLDEA
jgi:hypothetical protein